VLFALRQPATLLGVVLGYVASMIAIAAVVRRFERAGTGRQVTGKPAVWRYQSWLDPYAAVAALLAGIGWAPRPEVHRGFGSSERRRLWTVALICVVVPGLLAAAGLAGYIEAAGRGLLPFVATTDVLHGSQGVAQSTAERVALGFGIESLSIALLSIVPLPPLATGVAVWSTLPRTPGARRLAYRLLDEHWGIGALLVLMIIPLAGEQPALLAVVGSISDSIVHAL
jgi:hypothetical protein